jgi:hypothetical protein
MVACVRGARGCRWGRRCAHDWRSVGAGVSCEHLYLPPVVGCARHSATCSGDSWYSGCCCYSRVAKWSPVCEVCAVAGGASGAPMKRGVSALVSLASTLWCFPLVVGCARHRATCSGGCWYSGCCCRSCVAKWSSACEVRAVAGGASGAPMKGGVSALVSLASTCTYTSSSRPCEAQCDVQWR